MGPRRIGWTLSYGREPIQRVPGNRRRCKCRTSRRSALHDGWVEGQSRGGAGGSAGRAASGSIPPDPIDGATTDPASTGSPRAMASKTSRRCTGTSFGASTPSRTLSPRISTTTIVMSLLMTMLSSFFRDSTSIGPILGGADPSPTNAANSLTVKVSSGQSSILGGFAAPRGWFLSRFAWGCDFRGCLWRVPRAAGRCGHLARQPFV